MQALWIGLALAVGLAAGLLLQRRREARTLRRLGAMLEQAVAGAFQEENFDESQLSAVENRFARYLQRQEEARHSLQREKGQIETLIADISHQTKTPVANILLYAQLLAEQQEGAAEQELAGQVVAQAERLQFLIAGLVKASRLEAGIIRLEPGRHGVAPLLERAAAQAEQKAADKGVTLEIQDAGGVEAWFDPGWTEEALFNMVDNAVKYTPPGGRVRLRAAPSPSFACIDVEDSGMGVGPEERERVFQRFYRSPRAAGQPGSGLGLYLCRRIAADQGGYVRVGQSPLGGARFSLFLPRSGKTPKEQAEK